MSIVKIGMSPFQLNPPPSLPFPNFKSHPQLFHSFLHLTGKCVRLFLHTHFPFSCIKLKIFSLIFARLFCLHVSSHLLFNNFSYRLFVSLLCVLPHVSETDCAPYVPLISLATSQPQISQLIILPNPHDLAL